MLIAVLVAAAASLNDPQIATIALTAHQIDVDRGKLALRHTKNEEVKQFAEQMVNDHQEIREIRGHHTNSFSCATSTRRK